MIGFYLFIFIKDREGKKWGKGREGTKNEKEMKRSGKGKRKEKTEKGREVSSTCLFVFFLFSHKNSTIYEYAN